MAIDAYIDKISIIEPHPDPEVTSLELCKVRNDTCVIRKGTFEVGESVLKIVEDARLNPEYAWTSPYLGYLGGHYRVKTVKLRGVPSRGLIISLSEPTIQSALAGLDYINATPEQLCEKLGITHYEAITQDQQAKSGSLPTGIEKSDEENWQSLSARELHLGEPALVTKKVDGSSATLYYNPHTNQVEFCSRSLTLKDRTDEGTLIENNYLKALMPLVSKIKQLGNFFNETIAIRGEIYGNGVNGHKANKDAKKPLGFAMYGVRFPEADNEQKRMGRYKSGWHFLDINSTLGVLGESPIETVPVLEYVDSLTLDMLKEYSSRPASDGEGVVLNGMSWSYKAKSDDYCSKIK